MFKFSTRSEHRLRTCHADLQRTFRRALGYGVIDFGIADGHRGEERQNQYHDQGLSKVRWPNGRHNAFPSDAADLRPYVPGVDMNAPASAKYWYLLAGTVLAAAREEGVGFRWGGDWDGDSDMDDQTFNDLGHFERRPR